MASIQDMLHLGLVKVGDTVEFTFKGNVFQAKILRGGLLGKCMQKGIHQQEAVPVLQSTIGFASLTAWTESCLQDLLEEYYTRYSSWKRVFHKETKRSMSDLRDQCKLKDTKRKHEDVVELYKEIFRLQATIDEMNTHIKCLHNGESLPYKNWSYLHIEPQIKETPTVKKPKKTYNNQIYTNAQNAMCNKSSELTSIVSSILVNEQFS